MFDPESNPRRNPIPGWRRFEYPSSAVSLLQQAVFRNSLEVHDGYIGLRCFPDSHRFQPKIRAFQFPADKRNIGPDRFVKAILGTSNINLGFGFRYGSPFAARRFPMMQPSQLSTKTAMSPDNRACIMTFQSFRYLASPTVNALARTISKIF